MWTADQPEPQGWRGCLTIEPSPMTGRRPVSAPRSYSGLPHFESLGATGSSWNKPACLVRYPASHRWACSAVMQASALFRSRRCCGAIVRLASRLDRIARLHQVRDGLALIGGSQLGTLGVVLQVLPDHVLVAIEPDRNRFPADMMPDVIDYECSTTGRKHGGPLLERVLDLFDWRKFVWRPNRRVQIPRETDCKAGGPVCCLNSRPPQFADITLQEACADGNVRSGYRHNPARQPDWICSEVACRRMPSARPHGWSCRRKPGSHEPGDAVDARLCCEDSNAAAKEIDDLQHGAPHHLKRRAILRASNSSASGVAWSQEQRAYQ